MIQKPLVLTALITSNKSEAELHLPSSVPSRATGLSTCHIVVTTEHVPFLPTKYAHLSFV
ncbi:hypothetical protein PILCRDRAFT_814846, partial [Piloderma croceum F 1598]